jgi:hypothetical protein
MLEKVCSLICARPLTLYAGGVLPDPGKSFSIDRNINAQAMDMHGEKVAKTRLMDAQKKKKKMTLRLRPRAIPQKVTLAHIIRTYMADGGGKKKGKKGKKAVSTERNADVWAGLAQFEQQAPAEEPVKPEGSTLRGGCQSYVWCPNYQCCSCGRGRPHIYGRQS